MQISPFQSKVSAAAMPLDQMSKDQRVATKDKVGELSRQFESMLLRQILTEAQKIKLDSKKGEGDKTSSSVYQDMVTEQLADSMSQGDGIGLGKSLQVQLSREVKTTKPGGVPVPAHPAN